MTKIRITKELGDFKVGDELVVIQKLHHHWKIMTPAGDDYLVSNYYAVEIAEPITISSLLQHLSVHNAKYRELEMTCEELRKAAEVAQDFVTGQEKRNQDNEALIRELRAERVKLQDELANAGKLESTSGPVLNTASDFLNEASRLVGGDRAAAHGDKSLNFGRTVTLWNAYLAMRPNPSAALDGIDFAYMMTLVKIARTHSGNRHNLDNPLDGAGYMGCAGELLAREADVLSNGITGTMGTGYWGGSEPSAVALTYKGAIAGGYWHCPEDMHFYKRDGDQFKRLEAWPGDWAIHREEFPIYHLSSPARKRAIPSGIYWDTYTVNFVNSQRIKMPNAFFIEWKDRRLEFPTWQADRVNLGNSGAAPIA